MQGKQVAFLFPGQGAQRVGMAKELYDTRAEAREVFEVASKGLGYDAAAACFDGPDEQLNSTEYTQPLLLTACTAIYAAWFRTHPDIVPAFVAGLSLGEYTAHVAARSLSLREAVELTQLRGRLMQNTVPRGVGGMAAIIGLDAATVEGLCERNRSDASWVEPANFNAPDQVVVSGHLGAVKALCKAAKGAGALRALVLPVSAPFHSRLLIPAGEALAKALVGIRICYAEIPVIANVDAQAVRHPDAIKRKLVEQVSSAVRMEQSIRYMCERGITTFVEFGPGDTMSKLVQKIAPDVDTYSVSDTGSLERASSALA